MRLPSGLSDRRFVAGAVLIVAALLGAILFRSADAATVRVLAAARDMPSGHSVGPLDVTEVSVAVDGTHGFLLSDRRGSLAGLVTAHRIASGELLRESDLASLGPALREVSIPVGAEHVPSGRVGPGDRVDVLATYGDGDLARTVVVARAVEVVAVTSQQSLIGGGDSGALSAVTVACDARTASLLVFAARSAKVDIVKAVGQVGDGAGGVGYGDLGSVTDTAGA